MHSQTGFCSQGGRSTAPRVLGTLRRPHISLPQLQTSSTLQSPGRLLGRGCGVCLLLTSSAPQDFHHSRPHCTWAPVATMPGDDIISQGSL